MAPAAACSALGEGAWHTRPYPPTLPMPTALAVHGARFPSGPAAPSTRRAAASLRALPSDGVVYLNGRTLTARNIADGS